MPPVSYHVVLKSIHVNSDNKDFEKHFRINSNQKPCFYIAKLFILKYIKGEKIFLFP